MRDLPEAVVINGVSVDRVRLAEMRSISTEESERLAERRRQAADRQWAAAQALRARTPDEVGAMLGAVRERCSDAGTDDES